MWKGHVFISSLLAMALAGCGAPESGSLDIETGTINVAPHKLLGVNAHLWQATLDTLSFLPLMSADPHGGVINSQWYSPATTPSERIRVTVYIMDRALREDGLKVVVFRQVRIGSEWQFAHPNPETADKLKDAILRRALALQSEEKSEK